MMNWKREMSEFNAVHCNVTAYIHLDVRFYFDYNFVICWHKSKLS